MTEVWKSTTVTILSNVTHGISLLYQKNKTKTKRNRRHIFSVEQLVQIINVFKNLINHDVKDKELANFWFCRTSKLKQHLHTSWPTYKAWLICSFDWKSTSAQRHLAERVKNSKFSDMAEHILQTLIRLLVSTLIIKPPRTPWFFLSSSHQGSTRLTAGMRYSLPAEWDFLVGPVHIWSGITDEKEGLTVPDAH